MKRNILKFICGLGLVCGLWSCESGNKTYPDFEGGTSVYFPYQYPVRTIVLGDDEYDTSIDKEHKCQIMATFGGSYNGSNGTVQVAVDESLVNNLFFEDGVTPVKAMPSNYYTLSTTSLAFNGTMNGVTEVQLSDAFFNDPDAVKNTYVIPLVITSQTGFGKILSGTLNEGMSGSRTNDAVWNVLPMDYVLYCVKYQNKYSGWWLSNGNTSTANIEKAQSYEIKTKSMNSCIYTISRTKDYVAKVLGEDGNPTLDEEGNEAKKVEQRIFKVDLLLTFDGSENCTITSLTDGVAASGTGKWGDNTEIKAWGNKDRDGLELNYSVDFGTDDFGNPITDVTHEKMIWQRSGVKIEEFAPVYIK